MKERKSRKWNAVTFLAIFQFSSIPRLALVWELPLLDNSILLLLNHEKVTAARELRSHHRELESRELESLTVTSGGSWSPPPAPQKLFVCGYDKTKVFSHLFPEYAHLLTSKIVLTRETASRAGQDDLLIAGLGGYCDGWGKQKLNATWLQHHFQGIVLWFNGEYFGPYDDVIKDELYGNKQSVTVFVPPPRQYHFGFEADGCQSARMTFLSMFFLDYLQAKRDNLLVPAQKPKNTGEHFLVYVAKNCVGFREEAFDQLALLDLGTVHYGSSCRGKLRNHSNVEKADIPPPRRYYDNYQALRAFRFCLVMENTRLDGYITEKILLAFMGGCIPIYYGTQQVLDIFNPKAFIYYDIDDPGPALREVARLEHDREAYQKVLQEPILLDGINTLQKYFSLSDDIAPNATIKQQVRTMVQRRNQQHEAGCVSDQNLVSTYTDFGNERKSVRHLVND